MVSSRVVDSKTTVKLWKHHSITECWLTQALPYFFSKCKLTEQLFHKIWQILGQQQQKRYLKMNWYQLWANSLKGVLKGVKHGFLYFYMFLISLVLSLNKCGKYVKVIWNSPPGNMIKAFCRSTLDFCFSCWLSTGEMSSCWLRW